MDLSPFSALTDAEDLLGNLPTETPSETEFPETLIKMRTTFEAVKGRLSPLVSPASTCSMSTAFSPEESPDSRASLQRKVIEITNEVAEELATQDGSTVEDTATRRSIVRKPEKVLTAIRKLRAVIASEEPACDCSVPAAPIRPVLPDHECTFLHPFAAMADDCTTLRRTLPERFLAGRTTGKFEIASSGIEALQLLEDHGHEIEVLFLDNNMPPGLQGVEIIPLIRSNPLWKEITVIFLTSDSSFNESYKKLGFDAYIVKPTTKTHVLNCLHYLYQELLESCTDDNPRRWITRARKK